MVKRFAWYKSAPANSTAATTRPFSFKLSLSAVSIAVFTSVNEFSHKYSNDNHFNQADECKRLVFDSVTLNGLNTPKHR